MYTPDDNKGVCMANSGMSNFFNVISEDGQFTAILPGGIDLKTGNIVAATTKSFPSEEQAQEAVDEAREKFRVQVELTSLSHYFNEKRNIESVETEHGTTYEINIPALYPVKGETFSIVGGAGFDRDSWDEAKAIFLQSMENDIVPGNENNILSVALTDSEVLAFSEFSIFDPHVIPTQEIYPLPEGVKKYLDFSEGEKLDSSTKTYENTIADDHWPRRLFTFVEKYLEKDGADIKKELGIDKLNSLTPKQAAALSSQIVLDLTEYYKDDQLVHTSGSPADNSSALEILREGVRRKGDANWEGNGVCRNFACTVKAVFEALKDNQTSFSLLNNTYCPFVEERGASGDKSSSFRPKRRDDYGTLSLNTQSGHAWNMFITISKTGQIDSTITDVTWVSRQLARMDQRERLDHTATRMEPIISAIAANLDPENERYQSQITNIATFYSNRINQLTSTIDTFPVGDVIDKGEALAMQEIRIGEREALATHALELAKMHSPADGWPREFADSLVSFWKDNAAEIKMDVSEMAILHEISKSSPWSDFNSVLKTYLAEESISSYTGRIVFKDDGLQEKAFEILKERANFEKDVKKDNKLYARMLKIYPQLETPESQVGAEEKKNTLGQTVPGGSSHKP